MINWSLPLRLSSLFLWPLKTIQVKCKQTVSPEIWLASRKVHFYCCQRFIAFATKKLKSFRPLIHQKNRVLRRRIRTNERVLSWDFYGLIILFISFHMQHFSFAFNQWQKIHCNIDCRFRIWLCISCIHKRMALST